jgi:hypothetical protein
MNFRNVAFLEKILKLFIGLKSSQPITHSLSQKSDIFGWKIEKHVKRQRH